MPSNEVLTYFDATTNRTTRNDLKLAVSLVGDNKVAIDCGCGAGSDIEYLRSNNFRVFAFDVEQEAISRCQRRFSPDDRVHLSQASFSTFNYPEASLIVADASLFFCPEHEFAEVWRKMTQALLPGGIFCGSFLGPEDTMASSQYQKEIYWPHVLVLTKQDVMNLFKAYKIESFTEHRSTGNTPAGEPHQWHIYSVVARKM